MGPIFEAKPVTLFAELVQILAPGKGGRTIARLLDGRATRHAVLNWRAGRRQAPKWAIDMLAAEVERRTAIARQSLELARATGERIGLSAGARNLAKWKVEQAKKKNAPTE